MCHVLFTSLHTTTTCNGLFTIGKFSVSLVLHEFVTIMHIVFKKLISFPMGADTCITINRFKLWCGMLTIQGVVNGTHLFISKPSMPFLDDYYYFKSRGYSILALAMVDYKKRFTNICIGMPRTVNDSCSIRLHCTGEFNYMDCLTSLGDHVKMEFLHISLVIRDIPLSIKSWCHLKKMDTITFWNYSTT
jgi:hypothetical protein